MLLLLQACASGGGARPERDSCDARLQNFEKQARAAGLWLSPPPGRAEFPGLGTSRLLASFDPRGLEAGQREDWLQRLVDAGRERRQLLARMLADVAGATKEAEYAALWADPAAAGERLAALDACARQSAERLLREDAGWSALADALAVADDYSAARRALGIYPLTSLGAASGVRRYQRSVYRSFELPVRSLPRSGVLRRFAPPDPEPSAVDPPPPEDRLGLAIPQPEQLRSLLLRHAPVWEVDAAGAYDLPGRPYFTAPLRPRVSTAEALVYHYASLTRFDGALRLQLNYLLWFDSRPPRHALDSLAGRLDGVVWRVTLDEKGEVLAYDSVHPCGCYHMFFPAADLKPRPGVFELPEPPLIVQRVAPAPGVRPVLRISSGEHYLQRVLFSDDQAGEHTEPGDAPAASTYDLRPYAELYAVTAPSGRRSLFDRHGLIPGTRRGERFYLWPMGIRSPGAMCERGRQATAFLGRRHFDDPFFLDAVFRRGD